MSFGRRWRVGDRTDLDHNGQLDELLVDGIVSYLKDENCWVATIDWSAIHHASDEHTSRVGDAGD